jgi:hypothetical protein
VGACDFVEPLTTNPNAVPDATLDQLLAGVAVNAYDKIHWWDAENLWLQQLDGIDRQLVSLSQYRINEGLGTIWRAGYGGAGLVDIRLGIARGEGAGRGIYVGILKVYEVLFIGRLASLYGDVPYSEAVNPDITTPVLDAQRDVYDAALALLDEAIVDLERGEGVGPGSADFAFGGDPESWIRVAQTLKARYHLHWVEVDGRNRYAAALAAASFGISDASGDWVADRSQQPNDLHSFPEDNVVAGAFIVNALLARSDPRLPLYFGQGTGPYQSQFVGSHPNDQTDPSTDASEVACIQAFSGPAGCPLGRGYGSFDYDFPLILTCAENSFIMAEAEFHVGTEAGARAALDAALACEEERKEVDLSATRAVVAGLSGAALFDEIMLQKYLSLFLANEIWNDYKRTCRPAITTFGGLQVPGRLFYPQQERETNPNIPTPSEQAATDPHRRPGGANANDPNPCP